MKTTAKLKKFGLTLLLAIVGIALVFTCFTFTAPSFRSAAEDPVETIAAPAQADLFEKISVQKECDFGDTFTVDDVSGTTVKVTAPNGDDVTGEAASGKYSVKALQVGNYKVTYSKEATGFTKDIQKSFFVKVSLNEAFFLRVDHNGAGIPTYVKNGDSFELPGAEVVYYDENKMLQSYEPATDVSVDIYDSDHPSTVYHPGDTFTAYKNGKIYITYSAKVGGQNGLKFFNKVFTVNSQASLSDSNSAPTLSVSGVTSDISINRPVTLPKATATDSYDDNVQIDITVKDPDGNDVKYVKIDRNGYAYEQEDKAVVFDNDESMTFYPVKTGDYVVTYTATNDAGKTSSPRVYHMTCKDLVAPVFKETYDYNIPETWGLNVKKLNAEDEEESVEDLSGKITFYVPEVVDNKDHAAPTEDGDTNLISLYFRITDADNSRTIISFDNILAADDSDACKAKGNTTYGEKVGDEFKTEIFNKNNPFVFDFNKYNKTDAKGEVVDRPGTYTVYFRARDKAQNTSSKTYTIKLEDEFVDTAAPSAAEVTVPTHISATDKTLSIPSPVVADAKDSRPQVTYRLYSNNEKADEEGERYITVDGGETADIETVDGKLNLVINKGKTDKAGPYEKRLVLGDTIYFYVKATDKVGNFKINTEDGTDDYTKCESKIFILSPSADNSFTLDTAGIDFGDEKIEAGVSKNVGGFKITVDNTDTESADMRPYIGFEIAVLDPNDNALNVTLETVSTFVDGGTNVYVKNITFKPSVAGEHSMIVTAFDVNGKSTSTGYKFNVEKSTSGGATTSAFVIGSSGDVNVTYKLHNEKMSGIGEAGNTYFVIRRISGGSFALMGSEFTAKTQGSYSVRDGYIKFDSADADFSNYDYDEDFKSYGGNDGRYSFSVTDTAAPVIEVQGYMPTYAALSTTAEPSVVTLPSVIAYSDNGTAEVKLTITDPNGSEVKPTAIEGNKYTFEGKTNGAYTVVYTATYMKASPVTATYTINIGDVTGPEFTVTGGSSGRYVVGDTFSFGTMKIADEDEKGLTITKKLIDPSKNEVSAATVNGSYSTYKNSTDNGTEITFSMAGQYEIVYTAKDAVGNETTQRYTVTVVSSGSGTPTTITTLSTVLIVVAVVLLAGVIIYVVRFRKVKEKKK